MGPLVEQTTGKRETAASGDFSLVLGGPLYQLLVRSRLIEPPLGHVSWRVGVALAVAWLPLLGLTIASGDFAGNARIPFLHDFQAQVRILFALPLLILAEVAVYYQMRTLAAQFVERQIVTAHLRPAFDAIISSATRLRNSLVAEIALLALVIIFGPRVWRGAAALRADTWYATAGSPDVKFTAAGYWYAFVSIPIFQFLLLRWYYRIAIWCRFLFQVSRLDLNLIALHPDRCCGLGFLGGVVFSFSPLLMAHSGIIAGYIADRILREGATLADYKFELIGLAVLLLALVLGPLCVFAPTLIRARLAGLRTYGMLASEYAIGFADKWTRGRTVTSEPLLGSADIQSLADLANGFAIVKETKPVPFGRHTIIRLLVVIAIPLLPLAFTMFSPEELLKRLVTVLL